jgi:site-specific DNA recombinase
VAHFPADHPVLRTTRIPACAVRDWTVISGHAYAGGHVARQAAVVEDFIERTVIARLFRPDAADLLAAPERGVDVAGLRGEAAAIRANLEEMAADRAVGLLTRAQMLAATQRGNARLDEIASDLANRGPRKRAGPLLTAESAAVVRDSPDSARS